jgi:large subunit ribosomal protein L10
MGEPNSEKVAIVAEVREKFQNSEAVVLTEYRGLNVSDMAALRSAMREAGGEYKVYKNTLVRFAVKELDLDIEELLIGPTAIAFTGTRPDGRAADAVTVAKALTDFSSGNESLIIKGGMLDGKILTTDEIIALSKIAPRDELLSKLAGGIAAPMQQMAALMKAIPQKFALALSALIEARDDEQGESGESTEEEILLLAETNAVKSEQPAVDENQPGDTEDAVATSEEASNEEKADLEVEEINIEDNETTGESSEEEEN